MPPQIPPADMDLHPPAWLWKGGDTPTPLWGVMGFWGANAHRHRRGCCQRHGCRQRGRGAGTCHRRAVPGLSHPGDTAAAPQRGWRMPDPPGTGVGPLGGAATPRQPSPGAGRVLPPELARPWPGPPGRGPSAATLQRGRGGGPGCSLAPCTPHVGAARAGGLRSAASTGLASLSVCPSSSGRRMPAPSPPPPD